MNPIGESLPNEQSRRSDGVKTEDHNTFVICFWKRKTRPKETEGSAYQRDTKGLKRIAPPIEGTPVK